MVRALWLCGVLFRHCDPRSQAIHRSGPVDQAGEAVEHPIQCQGVEDETLLSKGSFVALARRSRSGGMGGSASVRVPELAVGVFIVAASIAGAIFWQRSVEAGTAVLVTSRDLRRGEILDDGDLSQVILTTTGEIALIRASAVSQVIGRRVTVDLGRDTPLTPALLTSTDTLGLLEGLVGITVALSSAPIDLAAGDGVRVFTADLTVTGESIVNEVPGPIEIWEVSTPDPLSSERAITLKAPLDSISQLVGSIDIHLVKVVG